MQWEERPSIKRPILEMSQRDIVPLHFLLTMGGGVPSPPLPHIFTIAGGGVVKLLTSSKGNRVQ